MARLVSDDEGPLGPDGPEAPREDEQRTPEDSNRVNPEARRAVRPVPKSAGENISAKRPSPRQQEILKAYVRRPIAAQVARDQGMSERNVRRIIHAFAPQLEQMRRERDLEQVATARARTNLAHDWADATLPTALERLGELLFSGDRVAVQAIKFVFDVAFRLPIPDAGAGSRADLSVTSASRDVIERLERLADDPKDVEDKGAGDGE